MPMHLQLKNSKHICGITFGVVVVTTMYKYEIAAMNVLPTTMFTEKFT